MDPFSEKQKELLAMGEHGTVSEEEEALQQATRMGIGNTLKKQFDLEVLLALVGYMTC